VTISGDNGNWIVVSVAIIWVLFVVITVSIQYLAFPLHLVERALPAHRGCWLQYTPSRGTPFPGAQ
jgi:hypothetical protein